LLRQIGTVEVINDLIRHTQDPSLLQHLEETMQALVQDQSSNDMSMTRS